jgi:acyl-CoA thioester hydrolase
VPYVDFRHRLPLRVRWAEVDLQGVVFNGHYLAYCDVCVTEYWRAIGMTYPAAFLAVGSDLFVRKATLEYHASARYDDELEICGRTARLGTTSLLFTIEMYRRGQTATPLITGELVYVNTDAASKSPLALPDVLRRQVCAFETTPPEEKNEHAAR